MSAQARTPRRRFVIRTSLDPHAGQPWIVYDRAVALPVWFGSTRAQAREEAQRRNEKWQPGAEGQDAPAS